MNIFVTIFREVVKLTMFTLIWGFPLYLDRVTGSHNYLWFFALSVLFTIGMFSHYEDLERIDRTNELKMDDNEQRNI